MNLLVIIVILILLVQVLVVGLVYHKLSKSISETKSELAKQAGNVVAQLESLLYLYSELKFGHGLPPTRGWAASPDFLRVLVTHAIQKKPTYILECSSGTSTVVLARCLQLLGRGHVHSLENGKEFAELTRAQLRKLGLTEYATVHDAPLEPVQFGEWKGKWYSLQSLPGDILFDMVVVDGPPWFTSPMARYPALPALHSRLAANAVIFLDDAARADEQQIITLWVREHTDISRYGEYVCEKGCAAVVKGEV
jgi:predicted O-methyltransferase YrrM